MGYCAGVILHVDDRRNRVHGPVVDDRSPLDRYRSHRPFGISTVILLLSALGFLGVSGIFGSMAAFIFVFGTGHWGAIVGIFGTSVGVIALSGLTALFVRKGTWQELTQYLRR